MDKQTVVTQGSGVATAEVQVQSLAPELLHASGTAKKKKKKKKPPLCQVKDRH